MPPDSGRSVGTVCVDTSILSIAMRDNVANSLLQATWELLCSENGIDLSQRTFEPNDVKRIFLM